jgi:D-3-phosphoglycerate dehydrogenase
MARRIVVLDKLALGTNHRARLEALGELVVHPGPLPDAAELRRRMAGAEITLSNEVSIDAAAIEAAPGLRLISLGSAGYNHIDLKAARQRGVTVCHAPGCSAGAIAEYTLAAAIYFLRRLPEADRHVRAGLYAWDAFIMPEMSAHTVGVIGLGHIGARVAQLFRGLGCRVLGWTRRPTPERAARLGVEFVSLDTLLQDSNVISINAALTPETEGLIGPRAFGLMSRRPVLINSARGRIVDQPALVEALQAGQVRAAALDVLRDEPPHPADPLLGLDNVLLTPHSVGGSTQAFECLSETCVRNVEAFLGGRPQNVVS